MQRARWERQCCSVSLDGMRAAYVVMCGLLCAGLAGCGAHDPGTRAASPRALGAADDRLSAAEWDRLRAGERIEHPKRFSDGDAKYVGGVSYQLVAADPDEILHALLDPTQLQQMLPHTRHIAAVGHGYPARGLTLEQGNDLVTASYSVTLSHDFDRREVRFWLDHSRPSDIDDVRGFFRVEPSDDGRSLITVAAALDLGPGLARLLFENALERMILATPTQMKGVLEANSNGKTRVAQLR